MAVSSSVGSRLTIQDFCLSALQSSGLRSLAQGTDDKQWDAEFAYAKKRLDMIVNSIVTKGEFARSVSFETLLLTAGTRTYNLSSGIVDVLADASYIEAGQVVAAASGETKIKQITSEEWHTLSDKSTSGRPQQFWVDRTKDPIAVNLWQIPDEAGTIRFRVHRKLSDTLDGGATLDLEEFWDLAISARLEVELMKANSMPLDMIQDRRFEADRLWDDAVSKGNENTTHRAVVDHRTGW